MYAYLTRSVFDWCRLQNFNKNSSDPAIDIALRILYIRAAIMERHPLSKLSAEKYLLHKPSMVNHSKEWWRIALQKSDAETRDDALSIITI